MGLNKRNAMNLMDWSLGLEVSRRSDGLKGWSDAESFLLAQGRFRGHEHITQNARSN